MHGDKMIFLKYFLKPPYKTKEVVSTIANSISLIDVYALTFLSNRKLVAIDIMMIPLTLKG